MSKETIELIQRIGPGHGLADAGHYPSLEYYEKHGADLLDVC